MQFGSKTKLASYEIIGLLGAGGMGEVYRAMDTRLGREVALKVLPAAFASDPARMARFHREAETSAKLEHPNIVSIYQIGEHNANPYLVMPLIEGASLAERLADFVLTQKPGEAARAPSAPARGGPGRVDRNGDTRAHPRR